MYFALERAMAIAGRRLGLDPADLARRNLVREDEFPYRTPSGGLYDSGDYTACLERSLELARYEERRDAQATAREAGRLVGIGIACVVEPSISNMGYITLAQTAAERAETLPKSGNAEGATVSINPLGGITVRMATTPQGQGHRTVAAQVVGDVLGVDPADVDVVSELDTGTDAWTVASGNYSSRFSGVGTGAVLRAAQKVEAKLKAIAAAELGCPSEEVHLRDGKAGTARAASRSDASPGLCTGIRPVFRTGSSRACTRQRSTRRRISSLLMRRTAWPRPLHTDFSSTSPSWKSNAKPARCACSTTSASTTPGGCSTR